MPTNIGAKMDHKGIIQKYFIEKNNEDEVIALLKEQKKVLANSKKNSIILNDEYSSLIIKLIKNSSGKVKYHAIIFLSNIEFCMDAKNFYEMCQVASESAKDEDGNVRHACFLLIKNLNAVMIMLPLINKLQNAGKAEINLSYESFRNLFYRLHFLFHSENDLKIKRKILHSLEIVVPKMDDMARFWDDQEDIRMINQVKKELNKRVQCGTRN